MPNEITIQSGLNLVNGNVQMTEPPVVTQDDQASANTFEHGFDIGVSEEDLSFGDITTPGWVTFQNLSSEFDVQLGPKNGGGTMQLFAELKPGKPAGPFYVGTGVTIRTKAIGGTARLMAKVLDR